MTNQSTYRVITLPILSKDNEPDTKSTALAEKFRELRLRSLQKAPDAFASKYEDEIQRGLDHALSRLSNAKAVHFIALKPSGSQVDQLNGLEDTDPILDNEWLGLIVLLGPQDDADHTDPYPKRDPFQRMTAADREGKFLSTESQFDANSVLHFHLNGMFVDPSARGGGLGVALIDAAVVKARADAAKFNAGARLTICVYDHNEAARKLYEKAGFKIVEKRPSLTRGPEITTVDMELSLPAAT